MLNRIKSELLNIGLKFISIDEKIVRMIFETSPSNINEIVIMPAVKIVMQKLLQKLERKRKYGRVYNGELNNVKVSIIRSLIGAPNCAIAIECLKRCNTEAIIRLDVCGGIANTNNIINIGDILIPHLAYCDEGTSPQYIREHPSLANDLDTLKNPLSQFQNLLTGNQIIFISKADKALRDILINEGRQMFPSRVKEEVKLWTTDALFCESLDFVRSLQSVNVQGIDMESSILFLLGRLYNLKTVSILSVTDLPGDPKFDLLNSKEIHPDMEKGLNNAIKILIKCMPKIRNTLIA
ncbi:MAG: phosphorylase family protein [Promethearchaeota archaeon]|jgi:uridine phosphorylase